MNRFVIWCRRALARRAQYCIFPNQRRAERFQAEIGAGTKVALVWNCPRKDEIAGPRAPLNGHDVWLLYHGSIGPRLLPLAVLTALARLPDALKLRVIGYETVGTAGYLDAVRERALDLGILPRVNLLGPMPRFELMQYCQRSDIGLALVPTRAQDINMRSMTGASNKAFDYLACGLPLLVSELADWKAMFVDPGYGLACVPDDPCSIEPALRWLLDHPREMRAMGERGRQRIEREWNYESQFDGIAKHLQQT